MLHLLPTVTARWQGTVEVIGRHGRFRGQSLQGLVLFFGLSFIFTLHQGILASGF